jgi:hypothetical protein
MASTGRSSSIGIEITLTEKQQRPHKQKARREREHIGRRALIDGGQQPAHRHERRAVEQADARRAAEVAPAERQPAQGVGPTQRAQLDLALGLGHGAHHRIRRSAGFCAASNDAGLAHRGGGAFVGAWWPLGEAAALRAQPRQRKGGLRARFGIAQTRLPSCIQCRLCKAGCVKRRLTEGVCA